MIRVLVADDHAVIRDGLKAILNACADIQVVAAAVDGQEAVRIAGAEHPDVIVMDIGMPGLNGIEAARAITARWPQARIVMLSMHSSAEHVFRAQQAGAIGYLLKESSGAEVVHAVRAAHEGRRYLSPGVAAVADAQGMKGPVDRLSVRERQVLQLVVEGKTSAEIARLVHLSPKTVETYRSRLMEKLGVSSIAALVKFAIQHGITNSH